MDWRYIFLSFDGRISRRQFWFGFATLGLIELLILAYAASHAKIDLASGVAPQWFRTLSLAIDCAAAWPLAAVLAKRFQDRGYPPRFAWYLVSALLIYSIFDAFALLQRPAGFTPLGHLLSWPLMALSIVTLIELGFRRGTQGPNDYGPDPLQHNGA